MSIDSETVQFAFMLMGAAISGIGFWVRSVSAKIDKMDVVEDRVRRLEARAKKSEDAHSDVSGLSKDLQRVEDTLTIKIDHINDRIGGLIEEWKKNGKHKP